MTPADPSVLVRLSRPPLLVALLATAAAAQSAPFPAPSNMWAAQTSPADITLSWRRVPGALAYRLYAIDGGTARPIGETRASGERYVQRVVAFGVPHVYAIEAVSENGAVSPRTRFNEVVPVNATRGPAVAGPASVTASAEGRGVIAVRWSPVPGATAYSIGRAVSPGGYRMLCALCPTTTVYLDSATTPGARHSYTVVALTPGGASRSARSGDVVPEGAAPVAAAPGATPPNAGAAPAAPRGTIRATPYAGSCLSLGEEGNFLVRLADGSVRHFERVHFRPRGMSFATDPRPAPVAGISDAVAVATAGPHSLVLRSDGTILSWGLNGQGQLGSEAGIDRKFATPQLRPVATPSPVRDITNAVAVAAGAEHSVALLADGTVRTWGHGAYGVPGDGVFETSPSKAHPRLAPTRVVGIDDAVAIAATGRVSFALLADGTIRAWGRNDMTAFTHGLLGTGNDESTAVPRPVAGITNAVGIAVGGSGGAAALLSDGTVRAWGYGYGSQHPNGHHASNTPLPIPEIRDAIAISPHMALLRDGTVREFGARRWPWSTPKLSGVVAVASDHINRLALLSDGRLMAWGLKQFYPDGPVVRAELGVETARECAPRGRR